MPTDRYELREDPELINLLKAIDDVMTVYDSLDSEEFCAVHLLIGEDTSHIETFGYGLRFGKALSEHPDWETFGWHPDNDVYPLIIIGNRQRIIESLQMLRVLGA